MTELLADFPELLGPVRQSGDKFTPGATVWSAPGDDSTATANMARQVASRVLFMLEGSARRLQTLPSGPIADAAYREWTAISSLDNLGDLPRVLGEVHSPDRYGVEWDTARVLMFTSHPFDTTLVTWYTRDERNRGYFRCEVKVSPRPGARAVLFDSGVNLGSMLDRFISSQ